MATENHRLAELLADALDQVAAAYMAAGGELETLPFGEALDVALKRDEAVQEARQQLSQIELGLDLEEAVNALAARSAEAGLKLGLRVGRAGR